MFFQPLRYTLTNMTAPSRLLAWPLSALPISQRAFPLRGVADEERLLVTGVPQSMSATRVCAVSADAQKRVCEPPFFEASNLMRNQYALPFWSRKSS